MLLVLFIQVAEYKKQQKEEAEFLELEVQSHEVVMSEQQREKLQMDKERIKLRNEYALLQKTKHLQEVERKKQQQIERERKLRSQVSKYTVEYSMCQRILYFHLFWLKLKF